jgi:hypothetical protein
VQSPEAKQAKSNGKSPFFHFFRIGRCTCVGGSAAESGSISLVFFSEYLPIVDFVAIVR